MANLYDPRGSYPYGYANPYGRRGLGGLGEDAGSVYVQWKAQAELSTGGLFGGGWDKAAQRAANSLAQRGWSISQVTWDWDVSLNPYTLILRAYAPVGLDGAENLIADTFESAGFKVDRSTIWFKVGGTKVSDGDTGDDDEKGNGQTVLIVGALLLLLFLRR